MTGLPLELNTINKSKSLPSTVTMTIHLIYILEQNLVSNCSHSITYCALRKHVHWPDSVHELQNNLNAHISQNDEETFGA